MSVSGFARRNLGSLVGIYEPFWVRSWECFEARWVHSEECMSVSGFTRKNV